MQFLNEAAKQFNTAGMFEAVNEVYKVSIPVAEAARNFKKLTEIHTDLRDAFTNIVRLEGKVIRIGSVILLFHSKDLAKLAILPDYKRPRMLCSLV